MKSKRNHSSWRAIVLPMAITAAMPQFLQAEEGKEAFALEELVVTAQRRSQSIQDVANSIEALSGNKLDELGKVGFEDYIASVGGVGFTKSGSGSNKIGMRGVSALTQNEFAVASTVSTVGVFLDEVPVQGAGALPDLGLFDLNRVEVLKGPQGTLYGDGAMGGAIRMILNEPNLSEFSGKVESTLMDTKNGGMGHRIRGVVNVPIVEDVLAARVVGSTEKTQGWIDNVATGKDGVNDSDSWSLRATVLGQFTEEFSAKLLVMHDESRLDGFAEEVDALGDFKTDMLEDEFNDVEVDIYALTLKYDFDFAELSSSTSVFKKYRVFNGRFPELGLAASGFASESFKFEDEEDTFTQEFRLSSVNAETLDWTVGAFYRERERDVCGVYTSPNALVPLLFPSAVPLCSFLPDDGYDIFNRKAGETFDQEAIYGEINWRFVENLELTVGMRYFKEEVGFIDQNVGFGFFAPYSSTQSSSVTDRDVLSKVGLSWTINDDALVYFNVAEGFRSGGSNLNASNTTEPSKYGSYESDGLLNYELGAKTTWMDGRLTANGAIFYSDWSDVQAFVAVPATFGADVSVLTAAGDAEVKGVEMLISALPLENVEMGLSFTYQETEFVSVNNGANIVKGSEMPNAPELTSTLYGQYTHALDNGDLFARLDYRYVDSQRTTVEPLMFGLGYADDTRTLPSYDVVDLTVGYRAMNWYVTGFVKNLTDEHYAVSYNNRAFAASPSNPDMTAVGQPRTLGVTVGYSF